MSLAVCGLTCDDCPFFQKNCTGCRNVKGKTFWAQDIPPKKTCPIYDCSVNTKKFRSCGDCGNLPCKTFVELKDPSIPEKEHQKLLKVRVQRLKEQPTPGGAKNTNQGVNKATNKGKEKFTSKEERKKLPKSALKSSKTDKSELLEIPGVGVSICQDLLDLGIKRISDLKGKDPQAMFDRLIKLRQSAMDRCLLYVFRCAVYFASHATHKPDLLKWWNWKDRK